MSRKNQDRKGQLKSTLISLMLIIGFAANVSSNPHLDNETHYIIDESNITMDNLSNDNLTIKSHNNSGKVMDCNLSNITLQPEEAEFSGSLIESENFSEVKEFTNNSKVESNSSKQTKIDGNIKVNSSKDNRSNNISVRTDKERYLLGETVEITINCPSDYELIISNKDKRYFSISNEKIMSFKPQEDGEYQIILKLEDGSENHKISFNVISNISSEKEKSNSKTSPNEESNYVEVRIKKNKDEDSFIHAEIFEKEDSNKLSTSSNQERKNIRFFPDVKNIKMVELEDVSIQTEIEFGLEYVPLDKVRKHNKDFISSFAVNPEKINFTKGSLVKVAEGTELYKCKDWNFYQQECNGEWEKVMDLTPGKEYNISLYPGDPAYAETGLASINTNKSTYHPGEEAEITIVVLDKEGSLVENANVSLEIKAPSNKSYYYSSYYKNESRINEESKGIYTAIFKETNEEGNYLMHVEAVGDNLNNTMDSYFQVAEYYEFDIIRNLPHTIDPFKGPFNATINIISYTNATRFDFTETLPSNFTIYEAKGAAISKGEERINITWKNLKNNSKVEYTANSPLITPMLWEIGPAYIKYSGKEYQEARPWFLAIDPVYYYDPDSTITAGWSDGTGTTHAEIDDGKRQPSIDVTADYVASIANGGVSSEFGFPSISETGIQNITLWVYTATGSNTVYTFELRQGSTTRCSNTIPVSQSGWKTCVWNNPTGDLSDLRLYLSQVTKSGAGKNEYAYVYAAYLEVDTGPPPPQVELNSPINGTINEENPVEMNFKVRDSTYATIDNCTLLGNFSGSWERNETIFNLQNNTEYNFTISLTDKEYVWNVECTNEFGRSNYAPQNYTFILNNQNPLIENAGLNGTTIRQNRTIKFNASITDYYGINHSLITLEKPGENPKNYTLQKNGEEHYYLIENNIKPGMYNITLIWANDTYGKIGKNESPGLQFEVQEIPPEAFDLSSPANNTVSQTLRPTMEWQQTTTPDFKNYTLIIDKEESFESPEFIYKTEEITNTSYVLEFALDSDANYYWKVIAYDIFNNSRESTHYFKYTTDRTKPTVTLNSPTNETITANNIETFYYKPYDLNGLDTCKLFGNFSGTWKEEASDSSIENNQNNFFEIAIIEGAYEWNVWCNDSAGNNDFASQNRTLYVDHSPPKIETISPENESIIDYTNNVVFEGNATDTFSEIAECELIVNGTIKDTNSNIIRGEVFNLTSFLSNGHYEWWINCTDEKGWEGSSAKNSLDIVSADNDGPVITINYPKEGDYSTSSTINFNYTVEDATGIENCSIFINGSLNDTDYNVENFQNNIFSIEGFEENNYQYYIKCWDNSTNKNSGSSAITNFKVDLNNPYVNLNSPENDTALNYSNIEFNYYVNDTNLNFCALYTNESNSFVEELRNSIPQNNQNNYFNKEIKDGNYIWNVYCEDESGRGSFAQLNYSLEIDTMAPEFQEIQLSHSSPQNYSPSRTYEFNITLKDQNAISFALFENNFSGVMQNETLSENNGGYNISLTGIAVGNYSYRWFANDSLSNSNTTEWYDYEIQKREPDLRLYLNGSQSNITIDEQEKVNITAQILEPTESNIELYLNEELIGSQQAEIIDIRQFNIPGEYNVTAKFNGNANYTSEDKTLFINVNDVIAPQVELTNPENGTQVSTGNILLQYIVFDSSNIENCSLYINSSLENTDYYIENGTLSSFEINVEEAEYIWQVKCTDSAGNIGESLVWSFSAINNNATFTNVSLNQSSYNEGDFVKITTEVKDVFGIKINSPIETIIVPGTTNVSWWNTSWKKRKGIIINETTGKDLVDDVVKINVSGLGGNIKNCSNELRIIKQQSEGIPVPFELYSGDDSTWCYIGFKVNISASETNNTDYYVYYNNSNAPNPGYENASLQTLNLYAQTAATDEGTPSNPTNIIGFTDDTYADLYLSGGGEGYESVHGEDFIDQSPSGEIKNVYIRYRYQVPQMAGNWYLRYSVDDGISYKNAFSGTNTLPKVTSSWYEITNDYATLSWTELNKTRLQGRIYKPGGGVTSQMYLYWVEMNVTFIPDSATSQIALGPEESIIESKSAETGATGTAVWEWPTLNRAEGNYSVLSMAYPIGKDFSYDYTNFELIPDTTGPEIILHNPEQEMNTSLSFIIFNWTAIDYQENITCNLTIDGKINKSNLEIKSGESYNTTVYNLDEGKHLWYVNCTDAAGNTNFSNSRNFTIDQSKPYLINLEQPANNFNTSNNSIEFNWTVEDLYSKVMECFVSIDNTYSSENLSCHNASICSKTINNIEPGFHSWDVSCYDSSGNLNQSSGRYFVIVEGPDNINIEILENGSLLINWSSIETADSYNIYISDNYTDGFASIPNITGLSVLNYTDNDADESFRRFYKVSSKRGEAEALSNITVGKYEIELKEGLNMISLPFIIENYELENGTNNGYKPYLNKDCLVSLWQYEGNNNFERTDWIDGKFVPASGSEDFTSINSTKGYWIEANSNCTYTTAGKVLFEDVNISLSKGINLVPWLIPERKELPTDGNPPLINTSPENSVEAIDRFNSSTQRFEVTIHWIVEGTPWGWWPSANNTYFRFLNPVEGYYFDSSQQAKWIISKPQEG